MFESFPFLHGRHFLYGQYFPLLLATTSLLTAAMVICTHAAVAVGLRRKVLGRWAMKDDGLLPAPPARADAGGGDQNPAGVELGQLSGLALSEDPSGLARSESIDLDTAADDATSLLPGHHPVVCAGPCIKAMRCSWCCYCSCSRYGWSGHSNRSAP